MKVKKESENVGLKFNIQKTKIMVSGPITSWQLDGEKMDGVRFYLLLLGRKAMTNLLLLLSHFSCVRLYVTP